MATDKPPATITEKPNTVSFNPSDLSSYAPSYVADATASAKKLSDLQSYKAYVASNPNLFPNADFINKQLDSSIAEQTNINNYITGTQGVTDATKKLQDANSFLQKYSNDNNGMLKWAKDNGFDTSLGVDKNTVAAWQGAMGNAQWTSQNPGINDANTKLNGLKSQVMSGFVVPRQDFSQGKADLEKYYNDPNTGQVALSTRDANQDIYSKRWGTVQASNEGLNKMGLLGSGARKNQTNNINAAAYNQSQGITANAVSQAQKNIGDYMNYGANQNASATGVENNVKNAGLGSLFGSSTNQAISDYGKASNIGNQNAITGAQQAIQKQTADDEFWNGLAKTVGGTVGTVAGVATGKLI